MATAAGPEDLPPLEELPPLEDLPPLLPAPRCDGACVVCQDEGEVLSLACSHTYCCDCLRGQLSARWPGQRVTFGYLGCGVCRQPLEHEEVAAELAAHHGLRQKAEKVATEQFLEDGLDHELVLELGHYPTNDEMRARAGDAMVVHLCSDCGEPYCAGRADCAAQLADCEPQAARRCAQCEWKTQGWDKSRCMVHGHKFAMYKCDSCCDVAVWSCFSHRYCDRCHREASEPKHYPCPGPELCPLGGAHPPNRTAVHGIGDKASFVIGCRACMGCLEAEEYMETNEGNAFGYPRRDWLSFGSADEVLALVAEKELMDRLIARVGLAATAGLDLHKVAARLLHMEQEEQRARREEEEQRALRQEEERRALERQEEERFLECAAQVALMEAEHLEARDRSPLDDCRLARESREAARSTRALRGRRRRLRAAAQAERRVGLTCLAGSQARVGRGARRSDAQRGGRHKLPAVQWLDLGCDGVPEAETAPSLLDDGQEVVGVALDLMS